MAAKKKKTKQERDDFEPEDDAPKQSKKQRDDDEDDAPRRQSKKPKDDDEPDEDADELPVDLEDEDEPDEEQEAGQFAGLDEDEDAEQAKDHGGDDEVPEDEEEEEEEPAPKPKVTMLNIILIFLNLLAAPTFLVMLVLDQNVRSHWSYVVFLNHVRVEGLPLEEEENAITGWQETRPRLRIDPARLKQFYDTSHPKPPQTLFKQTEPWQQVDEPITLRIRPSDLDEDVLKHVFSPVGGNAPVNTLEKEVRRLKTALPDAIKLKADERAAAVDAEALKQKKAPDDLRRELAAKAFLSLAWNTQQVAAIERKLKSITDKAGLDAILKDALQRRMLADILAPWEIYRPSDLEKFTVERMVELRAPGIEKGTQFKDVPGEKLEFTYKLDDLYGFLDRRLDQLASPTFSKETHLGEAFDKAIADAGASDAKARQRDSAEKRHAIAFLLFELGNVQVPFMEGAKLEAADKRIFSKGLERAQVVSGLHEFTMAARDYARALGVLEERVMYAIAVDRDGYRIADAEGKLDRTEGYTDRHAAAIRQIRELHAQVHFAKLRLENLQTQHKRYDDVIAKRKDHVAQLTDKLLKARAETNKDLQLLREMQDRLFRAQVELSDASDRNDVLEVEIRDLERKLGKVTKGTKGGKQP